MELVQVRISRRVKAAFEKAVKKEGRSSSEILRLLITDWLERMHPDMLKQEASGQLKAPKARSEQGIQPSRVVYPVVCWRCQSRIDWCAEEGSQCRCSNCGALWTPIRSC
jgi:Ribbon-helix-helix protein, copG family